MGVNNEAVFSDIQVSTKTKDGVVVDPQTSFDPPVTHLFGGFSYDKMALGVQWSAVWLYGNEIKCIETKAWTYAPGGYATPIVSFQQTSGYQANTQCSYLWGIHGRLQGISRLPVLFPLLPERRREHPHLAPHPHSHLQPH